ncbi:MAG TPA: sigma-70 family RNA polymerase sigma factor [Urbifossiella sp.]|nr:sigma-70 family RNA polymerase sigma factor [Urbifossiella sp.]
MAEPFNTPEFHALLARIRAGDPAARDALIRACQDRLERLTRRMLRGFPNVRRWADTGDVFQNATMRLLRALDQMDVADTRGLFNLAATMIRRELIDLARHFGGPEGVGANHASHTPAEGGPAIPDRPDPTADPGKLERWTALHEAAERLPVEEREVFGLVFYHGWTQAQVAALLGVDPRTVRRRWQAACIALHAALDGMLPDGE